MDMTYRARWLQLQLAEHIILIGVAREARHRGLRDTTAAALREAAAMRGWIGACLSLDRMTPDFGA